MNLPKDFYIGDKTIELRMPWIVPESIDDILSYIKPEHKILEFGSGGSTLFFADRCSYVLSFETLRPWYEKMKEIVPVHVDLKFVSNINEIKADAIFDLALVDICNISRPDLMKFAMTKFRNNRSLKLLVIDNYDADYCKGIDSSLLHKDFDDCHWAGKGTRVYYL